MRLITGAILAAAWLNVTGAYLGSLLSYLAMALYCWVQLRRYAARVPAADRSAAGRHRAVGARQERVGADRRTECDRRAAEHRPDRGQASVHHRDTASAYAATAVAAKVLIWVAIGAGFYLVPEVSRRRAAGEDTRPVLAKSLAIIAVCAVPCLLIFAAVPHLLLSVAFGAKRATASDSLLVLGLAFTVLAATYLAIQYMLALKRTRFLIPLARGRDRRAVHRCVNGPKHPAGFAAVVLAVQAAAAVVAFGFALRRDRAPAVPAGAPSPTAAEPAPELSREPALDKL